MDDLKLLLLLLAVNGAPIVAYDLLRQRWETPLDGGRVLTDGQRLFGRSCTLRGWLAALLTGALGAAVLGLPAAVGLLIGATAMAGDTLSSFVKRRLGLAPGSMALGLDQVPESLLPLLAVHSAFALDATRIVLLVTAFFVLELLLSRVLYKLHLRKDPH